VPDSERQLPKAWQRLQLYKAINHARRMIGRI
jgi:hypothetical protein